MLRNRLGGVLACSGSAPTTRGRPPRLETRDHPTTEAIMDGKPHNKVLATQLLLGQRARGLQMGDPEQRHLHAATTLLSAIVVRGAKS